MDIMIPYLGPITRLAIEPKSAFHIAGVQSSPALQKIELENKKKRELDKKKLNVADTKSSKSSVNDDDKPHLDTWA